MSVVETANRARTYLASCEANGERPTVERCRELLDTLDAVGRAAQAALDAIKNEDATVSFRTALVLLGLKEALNAGT